MNKTYDITNRIYTNGLLTDELLNKYIKQNIFDCFINLEGIKINKDLFKKSVFIIKGKKFNIIELYEVIYYTPEDYKSVMQIPRNHIRIKLKKYSSQTLNNNKSKNIKIKYLIYNEGKS